MKLHLVLKHKWFDMIESGEKPDEYRLRTPYWKKRLWDRRHDIDEVVFHRGYTSKTLTKRVIEIAEDMGVEKWGAMTGMVYYVIKMKGEQDEE